MIELHSEAWNPKITMHPQDQQRNYEWANELDESIEEARRLFFLPTKTRILNEQIISEN